MNRRRRRSSDPTLVDLGHGSIKVIEGERGFELDLVRSPEGELTRETLDKTRAAFEQFWSSSGRRAGSRTVVCAVPASGVSLRGLEIPAVNAAETEQMVALQVEREFPLPPEEMAWGYRLGEAHGADASAAQPATVAALRRDTLLELHQLFQPLDCRVEFSLGALAGQALCPPATGLSALLDLGRTRSELLLFQDDMPVGMRTLNWGGQSLTRAIAKALGVDDADAESKKLAWSSGRGAGTDDATLSAIVGQSLEELSKELRESWRLSSARASARLNGHTGLQPETGFPRRISIAGRGAALPGLIGRIESLFPGVPVEPLRFEDGLGRSAVTTGLEKQMAQSDSSLGGLFILRTQADPSRQVTTAAERGISGRWIAAAAALLVFALLGPYWGPLFRLSALQSRSDEAKMALGVDETFPRRIAFLDKLDGSRIQAVDVLEAIRRVSTADLRVDYLSLTPKGDFQLRGSSGSVEAVHQLRQDLSAMDFKDPVLPENEADENGVVRFRMKGRVGRLNLAAVPERVKGDAVPDVVPTPAKTETPPAVEVVATPDETPVTPTSDTPEGGATAAAPPGESAAAEGTPDPEADGAAESPPESSPVIVSPGSGITLPGGVIIESGGADIPPEVMEELMKQLQKGGG